MSVSKKPKRLKVKKPRNFVAALAFMRSGGGTHTNKKDKRKQNKLRKQLEEHDE